MANHSIFGATIYFGTDTFSGTAKLVQRSRFNFMSEAQIWRVTEHPVPNDLDSVKVLASPPAVLDLYM